VSRKQGKRFKTRRDPSAFARAIAGVKPLEQDQKIDLGLVYRLAFNSLRSGRGKETDFHTLACAMNIALVLCECGYGGEWIEQVKAAQDGLMRCFNRGQKTGAWGLDGDAMAAMGEAMALHDEQLALARQKEIRDAVAEVQRRIVNGETLELEAA
jgi:hypothetical protein